MEVLSIEKKLKKYAKFKTANDIAKFDHLIAEISKLRKPEYIPLLIHVLDDNTEFPEVMDNIVHALDSYPDDIHAKAIIENIPYLLKHAPEWLLRLIYRTLNNPPSLLIFKENMNLIPKESMIKVLDLVAKESEHHRGLCDELKKEL